MNAFLDFAIFEYTKEELIERVQENLTYGVEAAKLFNEASPKRAVKYIRPIRQQLDNEYSRYSRGEVLQAVRKSVAANTYYDWLETVSTNTVGPITSQNVESFLDNMKNYAQYYFPNAVK